MVIPRGSVAGVGTGSAGEVRIALIACAAAAALLLALAAVPGSALRGDDGPAATATAPAKKASFDSEAPLKAPAHWLPPEDWVYNHWLPYDEGRLYELLGVTRGRIWRQLRDDRHNLAELAAQRGWPDPAKLATALVAPRAGEVSAATLATLRSRAQRTITQGHLSQHLLFHSLHQFAIPSEAPAIFGVTDIAFRQLRRAEQSPLEIGRLHGRSPSRIQQLSTSVLRERARFGTDTGAMSQRQAAILLRRQISQLPRWLAQVRYNGPPPTHAGQLTGTPRDFAANPALSAGGGRVVFESYLQKLPLALKRGEISVLSRAVSGAGEARSASFNPKRRAPRSAYNPTVSADGRVVAFESAEGNLNFAKRYGQIRVFVNDAKTGRTRAMPLPPLRAGVSRSEYNPAISADGRFVAYQAQRRGGESAVYVTDLRTGERELASRGPQSAPRADDGVYDPAISGDGRRVAFTTAASNLGAGDLRGRTQVFVRDLARRTTTLVSRRSGARGAIADDYSADPAISRDGRYVAFSSAAGNLARRPRRLADLRARPAQRAHDRRQPPGALRAEAVDQRRRRRRGLHGDPRRPVARLRPRCPRARARAPRLAPDRQARRRRRAVLRRGDLRRRAPRRVHLSRDEPVGRQARRPPRRLRARPEGEHDEAAQRRRAEGRGRPGRQAEDRAGRGADRVRSAHHQIGRAQLDRLDLRQCVPRWPGPAGDPPAGRRLAHLAVAITAVPSGDAALRPAAARLADEDRRRVHREARHAGHLHVRLLDPRARHADVSDRRVSFYDTAPSAIRVSAMS